ncbi:hypothetical protein MBLNU230_g7894t1 [Neophaeotheca triangularis]
MKLDSMLPYRTALLVGFGLLVQAQNIFEDLTQSYCSDQNTGSDYDRVLNNVQSNGACFTQCADNYAFAVVQWQSCWCSNYIPANQLSIGSCNQDCPGYPSEKCGNEDNGLYGYVPLRREPSGTAGASSAQETSAPAEPSTANPSTADPSTEPVSTTSTSTSTEPEPEPETTNIATPPIASLTTSTSTSSTSTSTSSSSTTPVVPFTSPTSLVQDTSPSSTFEEAPVITPPTSQATSQVQSPSSTPEDESTTSTTPTPNPATTPTLRPTSTTSIPPEPSSSTTKLAPVAPTTRSSSSSPASSASSAEVSLITTTVSGQGHTIVVTSTPTNTPGPGAGVPAQEQAIGGRKGLSGGAIAGIVIGSLIGAAAIIIGMLFCYRRKKAQSQEPSQPGRSFGVKRNGSILSRTGLLGAAAGGSRRGRPDMSERNGADESFKGGGSVRQSMLYSDGHDGTNPTGPLGSSHGTDGASTVMGGASAAGSQRRHSRPLVYDQRLNPSALFASHEANGSRVSVQDNQDYSRPLGIANPDIRPSFESRNGSLD